MFYVSLMVNTKQKPVVNTQKRKESKSAVTENQITKELSKRGRKDQKLQKNTKRTKW